MDHLIIVSGDGHVGAPAEHYREYLEPEYREHLGELAHHDALLRNYSVQVRSYPDELMELIDDRRLIRDGGHEESAWDPQRRLRELDAEGIAAEIVNPGVQNAILPFFHSMNNPFPPDLRAAGARAYHRWLADFTDDSDGRIFGVADPGPCLDMDATVRELHWVAAHNCVAVNPPGAVADPDLPPLWDAFYEPFWAACSDLGLCQVVHVAWGHRQGMVDRTKMGEQEGHLIVFSDDDPEADPNEGMSDRAWNAFVLTPTRGFWQMMMGGVLDRYPDLKFVFTELRADWVPTMRRQLDSLFAEAGGPSLAMKPSEYFDRHCALVPSFPHRAETMMRDEIGVERMMFGADFPHCEGTWPNTWDWIRAAYSDVTEDELRRILGENAIGIFGLDRDKLAEVARRIGPKPEELLGPDHHVDKNLIRHFHARGGYLKPPREVSPELVAEWARGDIARHTGARV